MYLIILLLDLEDGKVGGTVVVLSANKQFKIY
jgi:hypothetical protein